jgi:hypothetical protein
VLAVLVALFFGLPPLYMAAATPPAGPVRLPTTTAPDETTLRFQVFVAGWGYHTSILVEQPPGWRLGPPGEEDAPFVEYSWGDRRFYKDQNYRPHSLLAAVFLPTASVAYLDGWERPPDPQNGGGAPDLYVRQVTAAQMRALVTEMERALPRTPSGERVPPFPPAPGRAGRFYPGRECYIFWSDCNAWTVRCLRAAGLAGSSALVVAEEQVPGRLRGFRRVLAGKEGREAANVQQ